MTNRRGDAEAGADETAAEVAAVSRFAGMKTVSDVVDDSLWPDLPKVDFEALKGRIFAILDAKSISTGGYSTPFWVMKCVDGLGVEFTTGNGGTVIVNKMDEIKRKGAFPLAMTVWQQTEKVKPGMSGYFDLRAPSAGMPDFVYSAS